VTSLVGTVDEMKRKRRAEKAPRNGYALLLLLFFLAVLVVSVAVAAPNILTERRREKEQEMIWRGRQYVRGIRLFYQKTHRLPTQLEDLYKPRTGIRFMRQPYKDPLNTVDGSWRLISVGPNGQLIGSLKEHPNAFFFGAPAQASFAGALSSPSSGAPKDVVFAPPASGGSSLSNPASPGSGNPSDKAGDRAPTPGATGDQTGERPDSGNAKETPQSTAEPEDHSPTLGQTIIVGVGSKINRGSVMRYEGAKNYLQFEFMWNGLSAGSGAPLP